MRRLRLWWARRRRPCRVRACRMRGPHEHCETCSRPTRQPHEVTEHLDDIADGVGSGTTLTALFCDRDCPGGCQYEHTKVNA